jgi:hypothetical protein
MRLPRSGPLVEGRKLTCDAGDRGRYGRIVAVCRIDGLDIEHGDGTAGLALHYQRYSGGPTLLSRRPPKRSALGHGPANPHRRGNASAVRHEDLATMNAEPGSKVSKDPQRQKETMKTCPIYTMLILALLSTAAAAACEDSDLSGRWQAVINFPGVAPGGSVRDGPGFGYVLSCGLRFGKNGQIRARQSTCVELSDGFADPDATEEFAPGEGRLRVSSSCGVTGPWGSNEIMGTLGADKATLIGVIEWSDGDIATFTAVRPGR